MITYGKPTELDIILIVTGKAQKKYSSERFLLEVKVYFLIKQFINVKIIIMDVEMIIIQLLCPFQFFLKY